MIAAGLNGEAGQLDENAGANPFDIMACCASDHALLNWEKSKLSSMIRVRVWCAIISLSHPHKSEVSL